jgi:hypothetical protein
MFVAIDHSFPKEWSMAGYSKHPWHCNRTRPSHQRAVENGALNTITEWKESITNAAA